MDCVGLQLESWRATLDAVGHSFITAELQPFSGMDGLRMLEHLVPQATGNDNQQLLKAQTELYRRDFLCRARPFPAIHPLFERLKRCHVLIGIATSCQKDELITYDASLRVLELTDAVACGDVIKHEKSAPSLLQTCLTRLNMTDFSRAVAIGDTPFDAQAAHRLGMVSVGVTTGGYSEQSLREVGCDEVFEQVKDVGALWYGL